MVYGVPIERPLMVFAFKLLGYDIRKHHFSTEKDIERAAETWFTLKERKILRAWPTGPIVYEAKACLVKKI